ncbi:MAG TPA: ergothioneine biosynthesis protein EgtB [Myxococcota bacterium]|nr:ergothioneine biosynthesis protein EgtB [Myxococcota bacterium]
MRGLSESLCARLTPEDCVAQSMPDASPVKWHLAHTTWFFETFLLKEFVRGYEDFHPRFGFLFNSYYNGKGPRHARPARGVLTRPSLEEVLAYRAHVDAHVLDRLDRIGSTPDGGVDAESLRILEIGLHHEQQHQELILTDVKHLFSQNALAPAYRAPLAPTRSAPDSLGWKTIAEGVRSIGHSGLGFSFDNERPAHRVFLEPFRIADRLITNAEYREFIADGGYRRPELWLDLGWATVQREGWRAPLYWRGGDGDASEFTLAGERELCDAEPVAHVSFFEADAFARWAGARLPTEAEWEVACGAREVCGHFVDEGRLHPNVADPGRRRDVARDEAEGSVDDGLRQLFGDLWEWTSSSYDAYPGYRPDEGTLGEYNGKFMCDQHVLRGGSCASSRSHLRASYRNFFHAPDRWQFSGIRLAKECP